jgi:hypothetical protein
VEQFGFRIDSGKGSLLVNTPPPMTLYPGEIGYAEVGLITKPVAYDRGTLHSVSVELYPYDQPNVTLSSGILSVKTQGFAIQGIFSFKYSWHLFFLGIIIIILGSIYLIIRRLKITENVIKPNKPWNITEEKKYLEKLLKNNKTKEYEKTLKMMKEEYNSAILWYKNFCKHLIKEKRKQGTMKRLTNKLKTKLSEITKKIKKKLTEKEIKVKKPAKEYQIKQKKVELKSDQMEEDKKKKVVDKIIEKEKRKREKTLKKIKNQQKRQLRKLGI